MFIRVLYHTLAVTHATLAWLRKRFTGAGLLVVTGLGVSALMGVDTDLTMAYQVFTLLLSLLVVSLATCPFFRASLAVRRILPRYGSVGQPLPYRLRVRNTGAGTLRGLELLEDIQEARPSLEEFVETPVPRAAVPNWFDRHLGYRRWRWLAAQREVRVPGEPALPLFPPNGEAELSRELLPVRRGHVRFAGVTAARPDPLGLVRSFVKIPLPQSVLILPKRYFLPALQLPGTRTYHYGRVTMASSVGDSEEFVALRDYRPGDPLRRIHWRSFARIGKPVVKEFQEEFFVRHALVLDTFLRPEYGSVFEEAVSVAASFACTVQTQESLLDLMFVGPKAYCLTAGRGQGQTDHLLETLASVQACRDKPFQVLSQLVVDRCASLSGCICVLLSWEADRQEFVARLRRLGVPTLVCVVTDPTLPRNPTVHPGEERQPWLHCLEAGKVAEGLARL